MFKFQVCHCWLPPRVDVHVSAVKFPSCEAAWRREREARCEVGRVLNSQLYSLMENNVGPFLRRSTDRRSYVCVRQISLNFYIYELRVASIFLVVSRKARTSTGTGTVDEKSITCQDIIILTVVYRLIYHH